MQCHRTASLSVQLAPDDPRAIGRVLSHLAEAGVRIDGNAKSGDTLRVLTPDLQGALDVLVALGLAVHQSEVIVTDLRHETGAIARVLRDVAVAGLRITYWYMVTEGRFAISAPDLDTLLTVLAKHAANGPA